MGNEYTVEEGVRLVLTLDSNVTTLVSTRIYPIRARQGNTRPYITYQRVSGMNHHHFGAGTTLAQARVQLNLIADSYSEIKDLSDAVRKALDMSSGTYGLPGAQYTADLMTIEEHYDEWEEPPEGTDDPIYTERIDVMCWYRQDAP